MSIIEDLYEFFPHEIVFKILSYRPNKTATLMQIYWHKKSLAASLASITEHNREMLELMEVTGVSQLIGAFYFSDWYMYNVSPQWSANIDLQEERETHWYLN